MSIIEGVGDEVTQFFGILVLFFLGVLAWWSTNISETPHIRTVLIVERRSQNVTTQQPNLLSQRSDRASSDQGAGCLRDPTSATDGANDDNKSELTDENETVNDEDAEASNSNGVCVTDNKSSTSDNSQDDVEPSNSHDDSDPSPESSEIIDEPNPSTTDADNIRIRLKYLNDDQKLVEGRLQELLGDFKRRHFRLELSAQKLVRLIFNGQVLQRDEETLAGCGLYDNCVVHCLVGQPGQAGGSSRASGSRLNTPPPDWNLGGLLYACLSLALGLAWVCRYNYSHLFTLTTTTALVGLTGMFAVSIVGLYMHDQETQATTN